MYPFPVNRIKCTKSRLRPVYYETYMCSFCYPTTRLCYVMTRLYSYSINDTCCCIWMYLYMFYFISCTISIKFTVYHTHTHLHQIRYIHIIQATQAVYIYMVFASRCIPNRYIFKLKTATPVIENAFIFNKNKLSVHFGKYLVS